MSVLPHVPNVIDFELVSGLPVRNASFSRPSRTLSHGRIVSIVCLFDHARKSVDGRRRDGDRNANAELMFRVPSDRTNYDVGQCGVSLPGRNGIRIAPPPHRISLRGVASFGNFVYDVIGGFNRARAGFPINCASSSSPVSVCVSGDVLSYSGGAR